MRADGLRAAAARVAEPVGLAIVLLAVVWWWYVLGVQGSGGDWAFDFRQFWQGASDVVHGVSPYPSRALLEAAPANLDPEGVQRVFRFPYPPSAAWLIAPLGLIGFHAAAAIWSGLLIAAFVLSVWVLGVRDWRVLAVVVTSAPVLTSVRLGTYTPILVLLLAVCWRWRDRPWVAGGSLALAISFKLFLWPLVIWLVVTRRLAAAALSVALATALTLFAWAAIGFSGLSEYPDLVRRLTDVVQDQGFSLVALGSELGLSHGLAGILPWLAGAVLLGAMATMAFRGSDERVTYSIAVVAAIALTPIVWLHYFALLVVPLALTRPRIAWPWALMWAFWLIPDQGSHGDAWRILFAIALVGAVLVQGSRLHGRKLVV